MVHYHDIDTPNSLLLLPDADRIVLCQILWNVFFYIHTAGRGWGICCALNVNWNFLQGWYIFFIFCPQSISMFIERNYLVTFGYVCLFNQLFHSQPRVLSNIGWVRYPKRTSSTYANELTTGLTLVNMKNIIFPIISITVLPKMVTLCHHIELETLSLIYWNM